MPLSAYTKIKLYGHIIMNYHSDYTPRSAFFYTLEKGMPAAYANISGNDKAPDLHGMAYFYQVMCGTLVEIEVFGLPSPADAQAGSFHGLHIHENGDCTSPFDNTGEHYNPCDLPHPMHAGDMPPLLGNCGYAYSLFYTDRFNADEITGRSIIIHSSPDDFATQPSGNSGSKIGCGVIFRYCG